MNRNCKEINGSVSLWDVLVLTGLKSRSGAMRLSLSCSRMWWSGLSCRKNSERGGCAGLGWVDVRTGWNPDATSKSSVYERGVTHDIIDSYRTLRKHCMLNTSIATSVPGGGSVSFLSVLQTAVVEYTGTVWSDPHTIGSLSWWLYSCSPGLTSMRLQLISEKNKCDCIIQVIWVFK